jgi:hypothetical protein
MEATRTLLFRIFVISIVVVDMRDEQSTMNFVQGMDNRSFAVEREGERRCEHDNSVYGDKHAHRPGSHVFPQGQHLSARLIGFNNRGQTRIGSDGCIGKVLLPWRHIVQRASRVSVHRH